MKPEATIGLGEARAAAASARAVDLKERTRAILAEAIAAPLGRDPSWLRAEVRFIAARDGGCLLGAALDQYCRLRREIAR